MPPDHEANTSAKSQEASHHNLETTSVRRDRRVALGSSAAVATTVSSDNEAEVDDDNPWPLAASKGDDFLLRRLIRLSNSKDSSLSVKEEDDDSFDLRPSATKPPRLPFGDSSRRPTRPSNSKSSSLSVKEEDDDAFDFRPPAPRPTDRPFNARRASLSVTAEDDEPPNFRLAAAKAPRPTGLPSNGKRASLHMNDDPFDSRLPTAKAPRLHISDNDPRHTGAKPPRLHTSGSDSDPCPPIAGIAGSSENEEEEDDDDDDGPSRQGDDTPKIRSSGKQLGLNTIDDQKASNLAVVANGVPGGVFRFSCPFPSCSDEFEPDCTYGRFSEHSLTHIRELFDMGINICPFGCEIGFVDALQQRHHVAFNCFSAPRARSPDP